MGNAKFCYFNLIVQDEVGLELASGGENPFYPLSNLKHPHALKTFRTADDDTAVIVIDCQTAATCDTFLAAASSIGTLDLTAVTIEANATDVWTSPAFSTTVTDFDYETGFASKSFAAQTYRYWRLTLVGTTDFVEVGKLFLGSAVSLTQNNVALGFKDVDEDLSTVEVGRYGQRFIDQITDQRRFTGSVGLMTKAERATMQGLFNYCGTSKPFWFILDPDELILENKDVCSGYFYFTERPGFTADFYGLYSTQFELEEAK